MGEDDDEPPAAASTPLPSSARRPALRRCCLRARPNDASRIFAHAQSEYWLGYAAWLEGLPGARARAFRAYRGWREASSRRSAQQGLAAGSRPTPRAISAPGCSGEEPPDLRRRVHALARDTSRRPQSGAGRSGTAGDLATLTAGSPICARPSWRPCELSRRLRRAASRPTDRSGPAERRAEARTCWLLGRAWLTSSAAGRCAEARAHAQRQATIDELARRPLLEGGRKPASNGTVRQASLTAGQLRRRRHDLALHHSPPAQRIGGHQKRLCDELRRRELGCHRHD